VDFFSSCFFWKTAAALGITSFLALGVVKVQDRTGRPSILERVSEEVAGELDTLEFTGEVLGDSESLLSLGASACFSRPPLLRNWNTFLWERRTPNAARLESYISIERFKNSA